jgi:hypothetical protein
MKLRRSLWILSKTDYCEIPNRCEGFKAFMPPCARRKITFDMFNVMKHVNMAVGAFGVITATRCVIDVSLKSKTILTPYFYKR